MKKLKLLLCVVSVTLFTLFSCQQEELTINQTIESEISDDPGEMTINYYDEEKGEHFVFHSTDEVVEHFKGTDYAEIASAKMEVLKTEKSYIEKHKLYDLPEDHELVVNYLKRFAGADESNPATENAIGGRMYDGINASGSSLSSTTTPVPRMRRSYRNRASSIKGGPTTGSIVLFDRTWYRGPSNLVLILPFLTSNLNGGGTTNFDNRTESFL